MFHINKWPSSWFIWSPVFRGKWWMTGAWWSALWHEGPAARWLCFLGSCERLCLTAVVLKLQLVNPLDRWAQPRKRSGFGRSGRRPKNLYFEQVPGCPEAGLGSPLWELLPPWKQPSPLGSLLASVWLGWHGTSQKVRKGCSGKSVSHSCLPVSCLTSQRPLLYQGFSLSSSLLVVPCLSWKWKYSRSRPTLCDLVDCSLPGFSVCGILQARILEWEAIPYLLQGIVPSQGSNLGLPHCRQLS